MSRHIPGTWSRAVIKPIPKAKANSQVPGDYRGISLQSFVAKSYCRILNNRLTVWLDENNGLCDEQNGFRSERCCQDHIFSLLSSIENRMGRKKDTFVCFIDFRKAFDCVNRKLLWHKLSVRYNINGTFLYALRTLYDNVLCSVDINHSLTDYFEVHSGVKQGCILSPTLFAMFIDDLSADLLAQNLGIDINGGMLSTLLYADDIVLIAPSERNLQGLINTVAKWCEGWEMGLNLTKTKIIHFRKRLKSRPRSTFCFKFNNGDIQYANEYKYLGLLVNEHLDWGAMVREISRKANRALDLLNYRVRSCGGLHFKSYTLLFNQLVQSIVMANSFIWGHKQFSEILGVQYKALRFFLGVGKACPIVGLFGETGWVPFRATVKFNILKFHCRLLEMPGDRVTSLIYAWSKSLADSGVSNWASRTASLLNSLHLPPQQPQQPSKLWEAIMEEEMTEWAEAVNVIPPRSESGGRLFYYRQIKHEPCPEPYMEVTCINRRRIITLLRCGCLPLEVESGRYRTPKTPLQQRICQICQKGVGDECHFLNSCVPLLESRLKMYAVAISFWGMDSASFFAMSPINRTILLLQSCSQSLDIGKAINEMFILRKSLLCGSH